MPKLITTTITITEADLALALAQSWDTTTCLVAQATRRVFGSTVHACSYGVVQLNNDQRVYYPMEVTSLQRLFDRVHSAHYAGYDQEAEMAELRDRLPAIFIITHTPTPTPSHTPSPYYYEKP